MSLQVEILSDVIRHERAMNEAPRRMERRQAARILEAIRCCTRPSVGGRFIGLVAGRQAGCCAAR